MQKREKRYFTFLSCLAVLALLFSFAVAPIQSRAEESRRAPSMPELMTPVRLDDTFYTYRDLLVDFVQIAYPRYLWFDDPYNRSRGSLLPNFYSQETSGHFFARYPKWLTEYALRENGMPKFDALNRWDRDITIGVGYPPPSKTAERIEGFSKRVEKQVLAIREDLEEVTGLSVGFVPPDKETATDFARIRIVDGTIHSFFSDNKFKLNGRQISGSNTPIIGGVWDYGQGGVQALEGLFRDAVRFTPLARAQVEGYFVTDKDNKIDFAVCHIWPHHRDTLFNALVTECLVRAMGLPEMPIIDKAAVVGHWNAAHDEHSKRYVLDGPGVNLHWLELDGLETEARLVRGDKAEAARLKALMDDEPSRFPHDPLDVPMPITLSEYDKTILSLLYCRGLQPGLSRFDAITILSSSPECFSGLPK